MRSPWFIQVTKMENPYCKCVFSLFGSNSVQVHILHSPPRKTFSNRSPITALNERNKPKVRQKNGSLKQKVPLLSMPLTDEDIVLDPLEDKFLQSKVKINRNSRRPKSPLVPRKSFESDLSPVLSPVISQDSIYDLPFGSFQDSDHIEMTRSSTIE